MHIKIQRVEFSFSIRVYRVLIFDASEYNMRGWELDLCAISVAVEDFRLMLIDNETKAVGAREVSL